VVDDENRENEGDIIFAADAANPELMGFLIRHTSGITCVAMLGERLDELDLPLMVTENTDPRSTAFTISVDARGTSTGISGEDRALTARALVEGTASDLTRPGHVYPLRYHPGGVLSRPGHTEAAVDLARLAGRYPAGVLAEVMNDDGTVARLPELEVFAARHGLVLGSIADLLGGA
jgi:3,4-dihydroxy-2-butanone 4-phosphate synthase